MQKVPVRMLVSIAAENWSYVPQQEVDLELTLAESWHDVGHCKIIGEPFEAEEENSETTINMFEPTGNSYDAETGELIGFCSVVPASVGEEHIFGDVLYVFDREDDGKLYFTRHENEPITIEGFAALKADEQKAVLSKLGIEGDAGNEEKRNALFAAYLESASAKE